MAAPKGNKFWQLRSKHGRDKLFSSPEKLWEAACEYFQWCDDNPLIDIDFKGKDITEVEVPRMRPYTIEGVCHYMDCNTAYFRNFARNNKDLEGFSAVLTRIEEIIYRQKFEGAAAGFLNPTIIARDLGLKDSSKIEQTVTSKEKVSIKFKKKK